MFKSHPQFARPLTLTLLRAAIRNDIDGYDATPWDSETWNIANWSRKP